MRAPSRAASARRARSFQARRARAGDPPLELLGRMHVAGRPQVKVVDHLELGVMVDHLQVSGDDAAARLARAQAEVKVVAVAEP